jgi:hypothetical protein
LAAYAPGGRTRFFVGIGFDGRCAQGFMVSRLIFQQIPLMGLTERKARANAKTKTSANAKKTAEAEDFGRSLWRLAILFG